MGHSSVEIDVSSLATNELRWERIRSQVGVNILQPVKPFESLVTYHVSAKQPKDSMIYLMYITNQIPCFTGTSYSLAGWEVHSTPG